MKTRFIALVTAAVLLLASAGRAASLDLQLYYPDIFVVGDVNYDAATDTFTASGFPDNVWEGTSGVDPFTIEDGSFEIFATSIDENGALIDLYDSFPDIVITGKIDLNPAAVDGYEYDGILIQGEFHAFGFNEGAPTLLEFAFDVTGGLLWVDDPNFLALPEGTFFGSKGGVIFNVTLNDSPLTFDFANGFSGNGSADVAPIPLPPAVAMGLVGFMMAAGYRRLGAKQS